MVVWVETLEEGVVGKFNCCKNSHGYAQWKRHSKKRGGVEGVVAVVGL